MSLNIGDIVKPKKGYVAENYMFRIINKNYYYPECEWKYKLRRMTQQLNSERISADTVLEEIKFAEETYWEEDELQCTYHSHKTDDAVDSLAYSTQVMGVPINQVKITGDSIQGGMPTPDKPQEIKNKNLFDGGVVTNNGLTITKDCASTLTKATDYVPYEIKRTPIKIDKINEEENIMDILKLYNERKSFDIKNNYNIELQKIQKEDAIQKIILEMQMQINTILENENRDERVDLESPNKNILTTESEEKINKLEVETDKKKDELHASLDEVKALFEMTEDYNERIKILKNYKILNKDGKLSV